MQRLRTILVIAGSLALAACEEIIGPFPSDGKAFSPPAVYTTWWNMTRACSGRAGDLADVRWFETDKPLRDPLNGKLVGGYWTPYINRIIIRSDLMLEGGVVRHEMLHSLVGRGGHSRSQFLEKCGGVVLCPDACVDDAGSYSPPPETPIHIPGDSLDFRVVVDPPAPSSAHDGGFFSITVLARNRSSHWATVTPPYPQAGTMHTFEVDVRGRPGRVLSGGYSASDPSERIFAPGETKRQVFDFRIGEKTFSGRFAPGDYIVRGGFGRWLSQYTPFVIQP